MRLRVSLPEQSLTVYGDDAMVVQRYAISSAVKGPGEREGSFCTPRGQHVIRAKVGAGVAANTVFVRRRATGEIWTPELAAQFPQRDWILTRLLWLSGKELGKNRLGACDTMRRYIYIHGSPDTAEMGVPGSIGCIRMHSADMIDLFDRVPVHSRVDIDDFSVTTGPWDALRVAAYPLREAVFVVEQGVPADIELDEHDESSLHAVAYAADGKAIGTGRLLSDGHIGRMAVAADWRGTGVGHALLLALMEAAQLRGYSKLVLNAQIHAAGFYAQFGFSIVGDEFEEAGIAHCEMTRAV